MPVNYLLGPVGADFVRSFLPAERAAGRCRAFGHDGADLDLRACTSWPEVVERLEGWVPELLVLHPAYTSLPGWWADCPLPRVALALDAGLRLHAYRLLLKHCEVALADAPSAEVLRRHGVASARPALLYGVGSDWEPVVPVEQPRDVDILFIGNCHQAIQAARLPWLERLARLAGQYRVRIAEGVRGADYRAALAGARVVFNKSLRGEANQRAFEALAAGALLVQEADNAEVASLLEPGVDYVAYTDADLEAQLQRYLGDEDLRRRVAASGQAKLPGLTFAAQWQRLLAQLAAELPTLRERAGRRPAFDAQDELLIRLWLALSGGRDARLRGDLLEALDRDPDSPAGCEAAIGLAALVSQEVAAPEVPLVARLEAALARWQERRPADLLLAGHRVGLSLRLKEPDEALRRAGRALLHADRPAALEGLDRLPPPVLGWDFLRVQWEGAAWSPPPEGEARAKLGLLRWWLHAIRGQASGDLVSAYEAVLAHPGQPSTRALLGTLLLKAERPADALPHLRRAVAGNPLDHRAAALLHQALLRSRDTQELAELQQVRRLWHQAAPELVPAEPWWGRQPVPQPGPEPGPRRALVSIVILCCNALEVTRGCLESLLAGTSPPYELILIDNGSADGTLDYLKSLPGRVGPGRWTLLRNEQNRGFAAGCNQGLGVAQGELVCFLNNDTVLPAGWLDGLRAAFTDAAAGPAVGMAGPVSNYTLPTQTVPAQYDDMAGFTAFAAARAREYAGKYRAVEVLSGFCLVARREMLTQLEGFDERFGLGTFEDNDLALRVRRAGRRLVVCEGVYLHHHGSRTFAALGLDPRQQQARNEQLFRAKWTPRPATVPVATPVTQVLPDVPVPVALPVPATLQGTRAAGPRPTRSLCLIVRDEQANLRDCVGPVRHLFDQVVVNDTGSQDGTVALARALGAEVVECPWQEDFALARNQSLDAASGDYVFWLDADDRLDPEQVARLARLLDSLGAQPVAYRMKCWCPPPAGQPGAGTVVDHVRLFPRHAQLRWEHRVHEQILPALRRAGVPVLDCDVVVRHTGYQNPSTRQAKQERNLRLLHRDLQEKPGHPYVLFNLGVAYLDVGQPAEALGHLEASLAGSAVSDSISHKLFALIAEAHRRLGDRDRAQEAVCRGLGHYPSDAELLFLLGVLRHEAGDRPGAIAALERLLTSRPDGQFGSVDAGLRGYLGEHNLACLYLQEGRAAEAEQLWCRVTASQPLFADGWACLAEARYRLGRAAEAEVALARLAALPGRAAEAEAIRQRHSQAGPN